MSLTLWLGLAASTLVSEDLACIAAGLLIQRGDLSVVGGVSSCAAGILAGDIGLWALGRLGGATLAAQPWLVRRMGARADTWRATARRGAPAAIVSSRFLPGTRLPLYVGAGVAGVPLAVFTVWSALAVLVWAPLVVLGSAGIGVTLAPAIAQATTIDGGHAGAAIAIVLGLTVARALAHPARRARLIARLSRVWRWEFWPMWLFYPPVALWIAWLSLRYGGVSTVTAANPGMADGGTIGESKSEILARLPEDAVIPFRTIAAGPLPRRVREAHDAIAAAGWTFPLVLKPDVGERGSAVKLARSLADVELYCAASPATFIVQPYHPGPYEAGVFYYRHPDAPRGRILSITDKRFPVLAGDGRSTLEELIWAHPRYRMQAPMFLQRHAAQKGRVLEAGERFRLAMAGNHSKGTMFLDGGHLRTEALERRIDAIARSYPGFFIGRFDIRYTDVEAFKAGHDLAIVELNGATAEPTDLYDPRGTLWSAYRKLFTQWSLAFQIGAANRRLGAGITPPSRLLQLVHAHLRRPSEAAD